MLKGDLTTTPIETVLLDLAAEEATGCLHVVDDNGDEALVYLKSGLIYAVSVPGQRPQLGARLISSNALVPENLAEALEAQRTELQGWRLGELLVHLGFVEQDVVEAFVQEQVRDGFTDLIGWTSGRWRFRKGEKTREDVAPPTPVAELLQAVSDRQAAWDEIIASVHGPNAVPMLAARGGEADIALDADTWSLLCKIDGERSIGELARECGFTLFEAGNVVRSLVQAGLVDVEEDLGPDGDPLYDDTDDDIDNATGEGGDDDATDDGVDVDVDEPDGASADEFPRVAALAAAFALQSRETASSSMVESVQPVEPSHGSDDETPALLRVSEALTKALTSGPDGSAFVDPFHVPDEIRLRAAPVPKQAPPEPTEEDLRRERIRQAAAAELAAAHAEAEALHKGESSAAGRIADVVNLEARREASRIEAQRREAERLEAERLEAERLEAERLEAERLEAERLEAERLEAERLEAERLEAERLEAERLEAERLEAERLEAERLEAERLEAERLEAERLEAERLEAERLEAERLEAERLEAERLEAERLEAERLEAERLEAERLEAERLEAERLEAERLEAERLEAERLEAERLEAERLEAERLEAERLEAERLEAERLEAERLEAERLEAERLEAERLEAERLKAERLEAERLEAERLEAERLEAERLEAERQEAERLEAERLEVKRIEAERLAAVQAQVPLGMPADPVHVASASAMLAEFSRTGATTLTPGTQEPADDTDDEPENALPQPLVQRDLTDTASLLRELSSLGFEDEPPSSSPGHRPPTAPRPVAPSAPKKKRGLFGR